MTDSKEGAEASHHSELSEPSELTAENARLRAELAELRDRHEALNTRQALLAEAERIVHMGSWVWDVAANRVTWSRECFEILGYDPEVDEASAEKFFMAIHPEDRERVMADSAKVAEQGTQTSGFARVLRGDGSVRELSMSSAVVRDASGEVTRIVGTLLDQTDTLARERELARTARQLADAQALARVGSWSFEADTGAVRWSAEMGRILGLEDAAPSVEALLEAVHPDDRRAIVEGFDLRAEGGPRVTTQPQECRVLRPDQSVRHVVLIARLAEGTASVVGTILDVTERRDLEAQLSHSQKMQAIGALAGGVAHDYNNYLLITEGNAEFLAQELEPSDPAMAFVDEIREACRRCALLTRHLLAFSRRQVDAPALVEVNQVVRAARRLIAPLLGRQIRVVEELGSGLPRVRIDPTQLEQIIMNLCINARDAIEGEGLLTLRTIALGGGREGDEARRVVLSVADTGGGILPEVRDRIFEPFFTTKEADQGTGLGLSTVHAMVERAGGSLDFDTALGVGTTFHVRLPVAADADGPSAVRAEPTPERAEGEAPLFEAWASGLVLVVDDNPQTRILTARRLERVGFEVQLAEDGRDALDLLEGGLVPRLVVSDQRMPAMTGTRLREEVAERWPDLPVLLMSGLIDPGSNIPLQKPHSAQELFAEVRNLLQIGG